MFSFITIMQVKARIMTLIKEILSMIRIILTVLPQNNWGTAQENYMFGIYRNIPFAIMGAFLIYWCYKNRDKEGLKKYCYSIDIRVIGHKILINII